ncbi:MAG: hypothetical protein WDN00_03040 [Limisphaerales bacterium]
MKVINIKPLILGIALLILALVGVVLIFGVADFSSAVRDDLEKPLGVMDYFIFALLLLFSVAVFLVGLFILWSGVHKSGREHAAKLKQN